MASQTPYKQNPLADKAELCVIKKNTSSEDGFRMKTVSGIEKCIKVTCAELIK